jgi:hypothetical protein
MASRGKKVGEGEKLDAKTINKVGVWGRREGLGGWVGVQVGGAEPPFQPASRSTIQPLCLTLKRYAKLYATPHRQLLLTSLAPPGPPFRPCRRC